MFSESRSRFTIQRPLAEPQLATADGNTHNSAGTSGNGNGNSSIRAKAKAKASGDTETETENDSELASEFDDDDAKRTAKFMRPSESPTASPLDAARTLDSSNNQSNSSSNTNHGINQSNSSRRRRIALPEEVLLRIFHFASRAPPFVPLSHAQPDQQQQEQQQQQHPDDQIQQLQQQQQQEQNQLIGNPFENINISGLTSGIPSVSASGLLASSLRASAAAASAASAASAAADPAADPADLSNNNNNNNKNEKRRLAHPLHAASLVSRTWNRLANESLWRKIIIENSSIASFVLAVLHSARFDLIHRRARYLADGACSSTSSNTPSQISSASTSVAPSKLESGLPHESDEDYRRVLAMIDKRIADASPAAAAEASEPLEQVIIRYREILDGDTPYEFSRIAAPCLEHGDNIGNIEDLRTMQNAAIMSFLAPVTQATPNFKQSYQQALQTMQSSRPASKLISLPYGNGRFVKRLDIPSWGPRVGMIAQILEFLPNWTSVTFMHPAHDPVYIPTLRYNLLQDMAPILHQFQAITIEDIDEDAWIPMMRLFASNCSSLKHLNIEAIPEKDQYRSYIGMTLLFDSIRSLEFLRMDGVPIGHCDFAPFGGDFEMRIVPTVCPNLRAVCIDYCDVTMKTFHSLWAECPNIEFIGLAGMNGTLADNQQVDLPKRSKLRVLRFVDCDMSDALLDSIVQKAPNLEMLRIVFEDGESLKTLDVTHDLTEALLYSIAQHCRKLTTFAISITRGMTPESLVAVLNSCPITALDFHQTPDSTVGLFTDDFFVKVIPSFNHIRVLNLFSQTLLTESAIIRYITSGHAAALESICLNKMSLTNEFLEVMSHGHTPYIRRIALIDCKLITSEQILNFVNRVTAHNPTPKALSTTTRNDWTKQSEQPMLRFLNSVYYIDPVTDANGQHNFLDHRLVKNGDGWFTDEGLDIFTLWAGAVKRGGGVL